MTRLPRSFALYVLVAVSSAVACGRTTNHAPVEAQGASAVGGSDDDVMGSFGGVSAGESGGLVDGGAPNQTEYAGAVVALVTNEGSAVTREARAVFTFGPRPAIGACGKCCCGSTRRGLPIPIKPPDAGRIELVRGPSTTALSPDPFENGQGSFHGMTDLGWAWFSPLSNYAPVTPSQSWSAGDTLVVQGLGHDVQAFSGMLRIGPDIVGVSPPIGSLPVKVAAAQDMRISWTPDEASEGTVLVSFPNDDGICFCEAPDSAGTLVVDGALLTPATGDISLTRLNIGTVESANATVDLIGAVVQRSAFSAE